MNFLCLLIVLGITSVSYASNASFIDEYINPSVRPYCTETQERLRFEYSFRTRKQKNINSHAVYLFTKDKVISISQMTAALNTKENNSYVMPEMFFKDAEVKNLSEFWDEKQPNDTFNTAFSDPLLYDMSFWLSGNKYRPIKLSYDDFKVKQVEESIPFSNGEYGFMNNKKIEAKGFKNIFGVDIADANDFRPIRVYVRDVDDEGNAVSFAFYNKTETIEEFENGKHYNLSFDSAAFLVSATSLTYKPKAQQYSHYFELRTRRGRFSLFDMTYNRDFLLIGSNEELLGCPPSFCQLRQFDDIIRLHDRTKQLIFHEWVWNFSGPAQQIDWKEALISNMSSRLHISRVGNFLKPFKFGIRRIIDGSFIDDSVLYIFRNGSFISSKDDSIVRNSTAFPDYTRIGNFFKGVPSQTYDAYLYHKESRTVFFIKEDKFWGYSMAKKGLTSEDFPKYIESLGLPYDFRIRSIYVEEDDSGKQIEFYLFTENHYIVFKENEFKSDRFESRQKTYFCTSVNFFGCSDDQFACPKLETSAPTDLPTDKPSDIPPDKPTDELSEEGTNFWLYFVILIIIIAILVAIIVLFLLFMSKKSDKKTDQNKPEKKNLGNKSNSGKSKGFVTPGDSGSQKDALSEISRSKTY